ncbi:MAG: 50S ribosomal protein L2 [Candidatus Brocadiales bacterium]
MGKRILVQRRGRGGMQFRANAVGKIVPAKYPRYSLEEQHTGEVIDILHETGRDAPLAKIRFDDGRYSYVPAVDGIYAGAKIELGRSAAPYLMNITNLDNVPDGATISSIERNFGDGGKLVKAAGSYALVFGHSESGVTLRMPSGRFLTLDPRCRAVIGAVAGGGKMEKPFLKAGSKYHAMRTKSRKYPIVRGVAMATPFHPHGGGRHQHPGKQTSVGRMSPPGRKVGNIAPRKTGTSRVRRV